MTATPRKLPPKLLSGLQSRSDLSCALLSAEESPDYPLHVVEQEALSGKEVANRRAEFVSGRAAANRAMRQLGIQVPDPVAQGKLGEPVWPDGLVGSITHSFPWTIAVVGRSKDLAALGIDLENISRLSVEDISREICTGRELSWVQAFKDPQIALAMIFSSKEALFKALSPKSQRRFDFKDVELSWVPEKRYFSAELLVNLNEQYRRGFQANVYSGVEGEWAFSFVIEDAV